jgi:mRNA interferase HigB
MFGRIQQLKVVGKGKIYDFIKKHADSSGWLLPWLAETESAQWNSPNDVKKRFSSASIINGSTIIFDVKGNKYRMEIIISFKNQTLIINRIGTHAEYNKWR